MEQTGFYNILVRHPSVLPFIFVHTSCVLVDGTLSIQSLHHRELLACGVSSMFVTVSELSHRNYHCFMDVMTKKAIHVTTILLNRYLIEELRLI